MLGGNSKTELELSIVKCVLVVINEPNLEVP